MIMQALDSYCQEVYYICSTLKDPQTPTHLTKTIKQDYIKMMLIGSVLGVASRFITYQRHYLLKNYVTSCIWGSLFGLAYSPFFLSPKIDKHKLSVHLEHSMRND